MASFMSTNLGQFMACINMLAGTDLTDDDITALAADRELAHQWVAHLHALRAIINWSRPITVAALDDVYTYLGDTVRCLRQSPTMRVIHVEIRQIPEDGTSRDAVWSEAFLKPGTQNLAITPDVRISVGKYHDDVTVTFQRRLNPEPHPMPEDRYSPARERSRWSTHELDFYVPLESRPQQIMPGVIVQPVTDPTIATDDSWRLFTRQEWQPSADHPNAPIGSIRYGQWTDIDNLMKPMWNILSPTLKIHNARGIPGRLVVSVQRPDIDK